MRESLTILACLLVAALTAALVGPWFVDWTAQRALIESQLSRAVGAPVTTRGEISLVLLPTPRLELGGITYGDSRSISVRSGQVHLELAVMPLLRGELRFLEATVDQPDVAVSLGPAGELPSAAGEGGPEVQFERIDIRGGRISIADPRRGSVTLVGLDLQAEAASLVGPFRGNGSFVRNQTRVGFRFSTGAREGDRMRVKLVTDEAGGLPRADLDGLLMLGGALGFEGTSTLSGSDPLPWRVAGPLKIDAEAIGLDPLDLKFGAEETTTAIQGAAKLAFAPRLEADISLSARQLDLDRMLAPDGQGRGLGDLLRGWIRRTAGTEGLPFPVRIALTSPAVTFSGETLTDVSAEARFTTETLGLRANGSGPGQARVSLDGQVETGAAARFAGRVELAAPDAPRLCAWATQIFAQDANPSCSTLARNVDVRGDFDVSAAGFSARDLRLKLDRSAFAGAATFTRPVGGERGRLYADLTSPSLDIDGIPDLSGPRAALVDADISLALDARAVRVARFGDGMIDAGRIRLKLVQDNTGLRLDTLSIAGLGGANVSATGAIGALDGALDVQIDAERLSDLAAFLKRVAPGSPTEALAARAVSLSPARLSFNVRGQRPAAAQPIRITSLGLDGTARGTRVTASLKPDLGSGSATGEVAVETRDSTMFLRQLGMEVLPLPAAGGARLRATLHGASDAGYDLNGSGDLAGVSLGFEGKLTSPLRQPRATGQLRINTPDAAPLLRLLGYGPPDLTQSIPIDLRSAASLEENRLSLTSLVGSAAGTSMSGDLAIDVQKDRPKLSGALDLDHASLPAMSSWVLGPIPQPRNGTIWADGRFGAALPELPAADVSLRANTLELFDGLSVGSAALRLSSGPGVMSFTEMSGSLGPGRVAGRLSLRRDGAAVFLSGAVSGTGLSIPGTWAQGSIAGHLDFTSTGSSPSALAAGMAGTGSLQLRDLEVPRADPAAPTRVIAESDAGNIYVSENDFLGALRRELDRGPLRISARDMTLQIAGGQARLASEGLSAGIDLRKLSLDARASLVPGQLPKDWTGPTPELGVVWRGPMGNPQRDLDAAAFVNVLAARAIAKEAARIEALEADLRERAFFARRQRGLEFLHRRQKEVADFLAEQQRLAAETAARAERDRLDAERRAEAPAPPIGIPVPMPPQAPAGFRAPPANADPSAAGRY